MTPHKFEPRPISEIAQLLGPGADVVEPFGWFKGKLQPNLPGQLGDNPVGKYVNVTAINPTPMGEGKTVVTIGLAMALPRLGHRAIATLREPSLAPVFGIKGGGSGGGAACLIPADDIDLHFTGDLHAVAAANNLLAAMTDNHAKRRMSPQIDSSTISWRRCVDVSDKGLSHIVAGLDDRPQAPLRETGFDLTAASEVMAILSLATSRADLRARLGRIIVARDFDGQAVTAEDVKCAGAMAALLRDAIRPNLVQTCEHTPALIHTGPFANIAHGNSSVLADLIAVRVADYVITESGFGSDCGAEKFVHIKCRSGGLRPDAEVLVCTARAIKLHSGRFRVSPGRPLDAGLLKQNMSALHSGLQILTAHIEILRKFGPPVIVAINRFPTDTDRELDEIRDFATNNGAQASVIVDAFQQGSAGATNLADAVVAACHCPSQLRFLYESDCPLTEKIRIIATEVYGAGGVDFTRKAQRRLRSFQDQGFGELPVCIAKTPYSLSHDPKLSGRPRDFRLPVSDARLSAGAGFVNALTGEISTMPGLPSTPNAARIDLGEDGTIQGLN